MKKMSWTLWVASLFLSGCPVIDEPEPIFYTQYTPVMMARAEMEKAIRLEAAREINDPAKIYVKDHYVFISEKYQGIHIIDNTNPRMPLNQAFIRIPGCVDIAVKDHVLYADNATDLLAIDLADWENIQVISRTRNTFPVLLPPDLGQIPSAYQNRPEDMIIVAWKKTDDSL